MASRHDRACARRGCAALPPGLGALAALRLLALALLLCLVIFSRQKGARAEAKRVVSLGGIADIELRAPRYLKTCREGPPNHLPGQHLRANVSWIFLVFLLYLSGCSILSCVLFGVWVWKV